MELNIFGTVTRYDIFKNKFESMPSLNVARYYHSSCALGKSLYIFCGRKEDHEPTNSIEKLTNASYMS